MNTRERFGNYLLLKKLSEDPLGEVFRAGRIGSESVEQVLLLRILNGSAVEGLDLHTALDKRRALQGVLRSPNIGIGVDAGTFQGVPFLAYDYVSGKDLAVLMSQAMRKSHPVPAEHALLVTERLAMGLAVAHDTRFNGERVTHGFMVPELVVLSNEGEVRVLGFEAARALRSAALEGSALADGFGRYLSPESRAGQPPSSSDDVYSLAVILLELLTGRPLPNPSHEGYRAAIEKVSSLGFPAVASLIERSLQPAGSRIGDVVAWHKALDQVVLENNATSTPFHLAFYMHNLFRDDIERESAELESEKTIDFTSEDLQRLLHPEKAVSTTPLPPPAPATAKPSRPPTPPTKEAAVHTPATPPKPKPAAVKAAASPPAKDEPSGRKAPMLIAAALALLLGGGAAVWFLVLRDGGSSAAAASRPDVSRSAPTSPTSGLADVPVDPLAEAGGDETTADTASQPSGLTPEEIEQRIAEAVAAKTKEATESLRKERDQEIETLRRQLAESQAEKEAAAKAAEEEAAAQLAAKAKDEEAKVEESSAQSQAPPPATTATQLAATGTTRPPALTSGQADSAQTTANRPSQPVTQPATTTPLQRQTPSQQPATSQPSASGGQASVPPASTNPVRREPPPPQPERVRLGQLVEAGEGVLPPRVRQQPVAAYPIQAKRLRKEAKVEVRVLVDENGKVLDTELIGSPEYGFGAEAERAIRAASFFPAQKNGVKVKMWTVVSIQFSLE